MPRPSNAASFPLFKAYPAEENQKNKLDRAQLASLASAHTIKGESG